VLQESFYESYRCRGHNLFSHRVLDWDSISQQTGGANIESHFAHFRGLPGLLEVGQNRYIEDWVRVFYNTVWVGQERSMIWFMFGGQPYRLTRAQLAEVLGVDLVDVSLHVAVYGHADPPRRALVSGIGPTHEISVLFHQPFPISYQRAPDLLTDEAYAIHMALRKTLLPRSGYPEGFTGHQQRLVLHILTHQPFDIIDLLLAKIENVITDGMGVARQLPYGHWINNICSRIAPDEEVASAYHDVMNVQRFPTYRPTVPQDPRRGRHVLRAALDKLQPEAHAQVQGEDESLLQVEEGLPEDLVWSDSNTSEEGDRDFFPDPEGGSSEPPVQLFVPSPPPTVSEAQVTQPTKLTGLLQ
jgi:hypothetical protein